MKVHCAKPGWGVPSVQHVHTHCGQVADRWFDNETIMFVGSLVWDWIPPSAFCGRCAASIGKPALAMKSLYQPARYAEIVTTIEAALHNLVAHMQTWPDAWHVDPHGTGNNPHVWSPNDRADGLSEDEQFCVCGASRIKVERELRAAQRAQHTCIKTMSSMNCSACNRGVPYPHASIEEILGGAR